MAKIKRKIEIDVYICERCAHEWTPRMKEEPRLCPKCKTAYWDKPKIPKPPKK